MVAKGTQAGAGRVRADDARAFGRVAMLYGGAPAEREVSLERGSQILKALLAAGIDRVGTDAKADSVRRVLDGPSDRVFGAAGMGFEPLVWRTLETGFGGD